MEAWREQLYLAHHGILGQKWGVRNGPPYPLGAGQHSASEKKAGWRKSLDKPDRKAYSGEQKKAGLDKVVGRATVPADKRKKRGLTAGQKRLIALGATAAIAGVAAYGLYKSGALDQYQSQGRSSVNRVLRQMGDNPFAEFELHAAAAHDSDTCNRENHPRPCYCKHQLQNGSCEN